MTDDHEDDHKELAINLQWPWKSARSMNLPIRCHILSMVLSEVWRVPELATIDDKKIHQKRHVRALFLPNT
jgi:hypothetical protein